MTDMTPTHSTTLRIVVALAFFATMMALIAILGDPPLQTWAARLRGHDT